MSGNAQEDKGTKNEFGHDLLFQSIIHEREEEFNRILSSSDVTYLLDDSGFDPLQLIVILGKESLVSDCSLERYKLAMDHKEKPLSLFHLAVMNSARPSFLSKLYRLGFDPNLQLTNNKQTPLHIAVKLEKPGIVSMLLNFGADSNLIDKRGRTPLDIAIESKNEEIIDLLNQNHAKQEEISKSETTPRFREISIPSASTSYTVDSDTETIKSDTDVGWSTDLGTSLRSYETIEDITQVNNSPISALDDSNSFSHWHEVEKLSLNIWSSKKTRTSLPVY